MSEQIKTESGEVTQTPEYSIENDPLFKPISDEKKKVIDEAVERQIISLSLDKNVDKDTEKVSGQNYALISVVSPQGGQKSENICLKIKGVFNTLEDANKHAEMLQKIDSTFDIYVVEMYSWLLVPPDPTLIEQKHVDSKLNEIIGGHRESQLKAKMYFEERKRELIENINIENDRRKEENEKMKEEESTVVDVTDEAQAQSTEEPSTEEPSTEPSTEPVGVSAESSVNITDNGNECPNSGPSTEESVTPSELMEAMVNETTNENPSKSWADSVEE
jgi:hypothetical protein